MAAKFEQYIKDVIAAGDITGAAVAAVNKEGQYLIKKAFGKIDIGEDAKNFQLDTTFWLASSTKLLASIAALQLVEEGKVRVDEPISRILPEWKEPQILTGFGDDDKPQLKPATKEITLAHLLTHSSGIGYDLFNENLQKYREVMKMGPPAPSDTKIAETWPNVLLFEPGEDWEYGVGIDWAGHVVEKMSGMTLGQYIKKNICDRLDMPDTTFHPWDTPTMMKRMHGRLTRDADGKPTELTLPLFEAKIRAFDSGGGGLYSTTGDYVKVLKSILSQDGKLLKPETVDKYMRQGQLEPKARDGMNAKLRIPKWDNAAAIALPWDTDDSIVFDHGLASALMVTPIDGVCGERMMFWGGLANNEWYIDMDRGVAAHYGTWIVPVGDKPSNNTFGELRKILYNEGTKA